MEGDGSRVMVAGSVSVLGGTSRCQAHLGVSRTAHLVRIRYVAENDRSDGVLLEGVTAEPVAIVLRHRTEHIGRIQLAIP